MDRTIAIDTETDGTMPWSIQVSVKPGTGLLVRVTDTQALARLVMWVNQLIADGWTVVLHHCIADLGLLESVGIHISVGQLVDTMMLSYHLGNLPQGLKALAYRLLGVRMKSWEDLVMPSSRAKMIAWLADEWAEEHDHPNVVEIKLKTKVKYLQKPTERERTLKRILGHASKPTYDLWEKAKEAGLSGYPIPSIAHAPMAEAIDYAVCDADLTGRLGAVLETERCRIEQQEWAIEEGDVDV